MKYAELPNGLVLKFPDDVTDKQIQRAVRKELGREHEDIAEMIEALLWRADALVSTQESLIDRLDRRIEAATEQNAKAAATVEKINKAFDVAAVGLAKTMAEQMKVTTAVRVTCELLNRTLDSAVAHTLDAMERGTAANAAGAKSLSGIVVSLGDTARRLEVLMQSMQGLAKITRRARRNRDGSWTLEAERVS
jgi:hypothetical protein